MIAESENIRRKGYITYTFSITNSGQDSDVTLEVLDSRIALPGTLPFPSLELVGMPDQVKTLRKLAKPDRYLWELGTLPQGKHLTLEYSVIEETEEKHA